MNEGKGDWCIVSIDGNDIRVKIVHKGRGKPIAILRQTALESQNMVIIIMIVDMKM
jgi:hypothetical protein